MPILMFRTCILKVWTEKMCTDNCLLYDTTILQDLLFYQYKLLTLGFLFDEYASAVFF